MEKILKISFKTTERKPRKDGKWQMIIFDVPERKRDLRNILRKNLYLLGYRMLQQSVWISPYDVWRETEIVIREHMLDRYIKSFLIEEIEVSSLSDGRQKVMIK